MESLADLASTTMEGALPLDVPLTVDLKVGTDWDRMDRLLRTDEGGYRRVEIAPADVDIEDPVVALAEV